MSGSLESLGGFFGKKVVIEEKVAEQIPVSEQLPPRSAGRIIQEIVDLESGQSVPQMPGGQRIDALKALKAELAKVIPPEDR